MKRQLGCRFYRRYVDDLCLLSSDPAELERWRDEIESFLRVRLRLNLRADRATPRDAARGVDWVGWRTWWNRRLPRRQTLANLRMRVVGWEHRNVRTHPPRVRRPACEEIDVRGARRSGALQALRATLAAYSGHLRHGRGYRAWQRHWRVRPWLPALFQHQGWLFRERWPALPAARTQTHARQLALLTARCDDTTLIFCRVGRYFELRGAQRLLAERVLGLRPARLPRAGYAFVVGFRTPLGPVFRARALRAGVSVLEVGEAFGSHGAVARREPRRLWVPAAGVDTPSTARL